MAACFLGKAPFGEASIELSLVGSLSVARCPMRCYLSRAGAGWAITRGAERGDEETSQMKKIEAIIKPFKMEDVKEALTEIGIE